jgi:hypothetical protein
VLGVLAEGPGATRCRVSSLALSRLSRRLEIREQQRTGTTVKPVRCLEDQVATVQAR